MKLLTAALLSCASANILDPWKVLPQKGDWKKIVKSFENNEDIDNYVSVYVAPFKELQAAARNGKVSGDTIKTSMIALTDMVQKTCQNVNITVEVFNSRDRDKFRKVLEGSIGVLDDPEAKHLEPVFKVETIKYFMFQRIDDMLVAAKTQKEFLDHLRNLRNHAKHAQSTMKDWKPAKFKFLIHRNLDLEVVKQYSTSVIKNRKEKGLKKEDLDKMYWKLHSLGNDSSTISMSSVKVTILAAVVLSFFMCM